MNVASVPTIRVNIELTTAEAALLRTLLSKGVSEYEALEMPKEACEFGDELLEALLEVAG